MRRTTSPASTRSTASGTYSHWRNRSLSGAAETAAFSKLRRLRGRSRGAHDSARGVTPAVRAVPSDRARRSGARTPAAVDRRLAVVRRGGGGAAAEHGLALTEADLLAAREEATRSWLERWV